MRRIDEKYKYIFFDSLFPIYTEYSQNLNLKDFETAEKIKKESIRKHIFKHKETLLNLREKLFDKKKKNL